MTILSVFNDNPDGVEKVQCADWWETTFYGVVHPGIQKMELLGVNNMIPEKRKPHTGGPRTAC